MKFDLGVPFCIKQPGDHKTQVGLSNHSSDITSITWWTLLCWHSVASVLWFGPFEGHPERTAARDVLSYDVKGEWELLFLLDEKIWGPTEKPCAFSVMVCSEWRVNVLTLRRWDRPRTNTVPNTAILCCSHKGWLTFRGQEDWDLMQEKMSWSHLHFRESASSMQLFLDLWVDNCVLEKGFSLYRE